MEAEMQNFFCDSTYSQHHNSGRGGGGGFTVKKKNFTLATRTPILGLVAQGAWELGLPQIRKCHFLRDPCVFGYIF